MAPVLTTPGSNAERSRAFIGGLDLGLIRRAVPAGRGEIARTAGLLIRAVSNIITDFLHAGWAITSERRFGPRGQPPATCSMSGDAGLALGVEIQPDAILSAWIDIVGRVFHTKRIALTRATPEDALTVIVGLCEIGHGAAIAKTSVIGAGVEMPHRGGSMGPTGLAVQSPDNLLDPQAIFLTRAMPAPIPGEPVARTVSPAAPAANHSDRSPPHSISQRPGRMTATLGAAALVVNAAFSSRLVATG